MEDKIENSTQNTAQNASETYVQKIIAWLQKNERHISAPLFVAGFIGDVLTLRKLPITTGVYIYGLCLIGVAAASILAHYLHEHDEQGNKFARTVRIIALLAAQFITGSLLSGCLIYYTKGASLVASWPFIGLLAIVFVGNEVLGIYRERLAFRSILFSLRYMHTAFLRCRCLRTL